MAWQLRHMFSRGKLRREYGDTIAALDIEILDAYRAFRDAAADLTERVARAEYLEKERQRARQERERRDRARRDEQEHPRQELPARQAYPSTSHTDVGGHIDTGGYSDVGGYSGHSGYLGSPGI